MDPVAKDPVLAIDRLDAKAGSVPAPEVLLGDSEPGINLVLADPAEARVLAPALADRANPLVVENHFQNPGTNNQALVSPDKNLTNGIGVGIGTGIGSRNREFSPICSPPRISKLAPIPTPIPALPLP